MDCFWDQLLLCISGWLELVILLPQSAECCWDHGHGSTCLSLVFQKMQSLNFYHDYTYKSFFSNTLTTFVSLVSHYLLLLVYPSSFSHTCYTFWIFLYVPGTEKSTHEENTSLHEYSPSKSPGAPTPLLNFFHVLKTFVKSRFLHSYSIPNDSIVGWKRTQKQPLISFVPVREKHSCSSHPQQRQTKYSHGK